MARQPEAYRGSSQFIQNGESVTKRPDKHTKRARILGIQKSPRGPKPADLISGQRPELLKPTISKRDHITEQVSLADQITEAEDAEEFREQGDVVVYSDSNVDSENGPLAKPLITLFAEMDELDPDPLATDSIEDVVNKEAFRTPDEKAGWDYALTAEDLRS